jgi:hypothetical protein
VGSCENRRLVASLNPARPAMIDLLAGLPVGLIIITSAFLFAAVDGFEPNRRIALLFKCALLAAGGAAIANQFDVLAASASVAVGHAAIGAAIPDQLFTLRNGMHVIRHLADAFDKELGEPVPNS